MKYCHLYDVCMYIYWKWQDSIFFVRDYYLDIFEYMNIYTHIYMCDYYICHIYDIYHIYMTISHKKCNLAICDKMERPKVFFMLFLSLFFANSSIFVHITMKNYLNIKCLWIIHVDLQ